MPYKRVNIFKWLSSVLYIKFRYCLLSAIFCITMKLRKTFQQTSKRLTYLIYFCGHCVHSLKSNSFIDTIELTVLTLTFWAKLSEATRGSSRLVYWKSQCRHVCLYDVHALRDRAYKVAHALSVCLCLLSSYLPYECPPMFYRNPPPAILYLSSSECLRKILMLDQFLMLCYQCRPYSDTANIFIGMFRFALFEDAAGNCKKTLITPASATHFS